MTSLCTRRTTATALTRTGAMVVVFGLAFGPTAAAFAQSAEPTTVQGVMGGDGKVTDVKVFGGDAKASAEDIPVTVGISQSVAGDAATVSYTVENTSVTKKAVSYTDAAGKTATVDQDIALPLVAQLSVRVPASRTDLVAPGARITKLADGSSELVWSLVLFNPIGSPTTDVSYTAKGTGDPIARLDVAVVNPNATPGLSATAQAANATVNGNGILGTIGQGASEGLVALSEGVGKLLAGLDKLEAGAIKLNQGIDKAQVGAGKLADGSEAAKAGSGKLVVGLGQIADGAGQLYTGSQQLRAGTGKLDVGAGKISDGLGKADEGGEKLAVGSGQLATGATAAAVGAQQLSDGLALISGGLDQLSAAQGLPAALDGAKKLRVGVEQLRAGLGSPTTDKTILNGVAQLAGGLAQVKGGLDGLATKSVPGIKGLVDSARNDFGCPPVTATPTVTAGSNGCEKLAVASVSLGQVIGGLQGLSTGVGQLQGGTALVNGGLQQIAGGLKSGDPAKPGVAEGLDALVAGLTKAVAGVGQLATGAKAASTGSVALAEGNGKLAAGAGQIAAGNSSLSDGLSQLYTGSKELKAGTGALNVGAGKISDGLGKLAPGAQAAATGAGKLDEGLGKIAVGQRQVADGLPAAVDGSGQIADGLGQVNDGQAKVAQGLSDVRTKAVEVLRSQFAQGTTLARQQLAGLDAATALANETPGAATTTYVLTQDADGIVANLASSSSADSGSNTGRNVALGAGGALLLLGGIAGGYLSGRRQTGV